MSKTNPWGRPRKTVQTETFTIAAADGTAYTFTLGRLGPLEDSRAADRMEELVGRYMGYPADPETGFEGKAPSMAFPAVGDPPRPVELSRALFNIVAGIEAMQPKDLGDARYCAEDIVALGAVDEDVWQELIARAGKINRTGKGAGTSKTGNTCAGDSDEKSELASATSTGIQN